MKTIKAEFNRKFIPVHQTDKRYVLLKGSAGSGKSVDTAQSYILRLMKDKGRNLMVVRKVYASNLTSTFAELISAINRLDVAEYWSIGRNPLMLNCINGNSIIFKGMNDARAKEKIKSVTFEKGTLTDIWLEEATEFTREDVDILDDRMRGKLDEGLFYQMKFTFNPVNIHHWIKKDFYDKPDKNVFLHESTYLDNRFTDESYVERMERRRLYNPEGFRIYGLGEWGQSEGLILTNWSVEALNKDLSYYDSLFIGQDFGYNHANAILLIGVKDGDLYILKEIYEKNLDTAEIIKKAEAMGLPKKVVMYCDSAEPDRIKTWRDAGYVAVPVVKEPGCIHAQIDFLRSKRIYIDSSCEAVIAEISAWSWFKDSISGEYEDFPQEGNDDAMAALRYAIEGVRKSPKIRTVKGIVL